MKAPTQPDTSLWTALREALAQTGFRVDDPGAVYSTLVAFGAPVWAVTPDARLPKEVAFAAAAKLARRDSTLMRVLPLVLLRNLDTTDWARAAALARTLGSAAELGMFLDWLGVLRRSALAARWAQALLEDLPKSPEYFLEPRGEFDRRATVARTPEVARRWNFWLNVGDDSFRTLLEKHGA